MFLAFYVLQNWHTELFNLSVKSVVPWAISGWESDANRLRIFILSGIVHPVRPEFHGGMVWSSDEGKSLLLTVILWDHYHKADTRQTKGPIKKGRLDIRQTVQKTDRHNADSSAIEF